MALALSGQPFPSRRAELFEAIDESKLIRDVARPRPLRLPRPIRVIAALVLREMTTTHGQSSLGYLWAILQPIGGIALLAIAISLFLRAPPIGDSFALFYATGVLPFTLFMDVQNSSMRALRANQQLLFYPEVSYLDAIVARFLLNMVTQALVVFLVLCGIVILFGLRVQVDLGLVCASVAITGFLALGIGTVNAVLIHLIPSWAQVWSVLMRPMFIASCIFFVFDDLPHWVQNILWFNPLVHVIGMMRAGVFTTYEGTYVSFAYPLGIAAVSLVVGLLALRRYARDIINF
jgi:capsular polysaccharide transport system permease protein